MNDYLDRYLFTNVCVLADMFQTFLTTSKDAYDLNLAFFVRWPQLA